MGLEAATYIHELDANNPTGADPRAQGDDHVRLLKNTVKNTFANVAGAVTPTHTELNYVDGVTEPIENMRGMPFNTRAAPTAMGDTDIGDFLSITAAGAVTLNNRISGFACCISNDSAGNVTLTATTGVLKWMHGGGAAPPEGNRTLARGGVCTVYFDGTNWRVWGVGLT